MSARMAAPRQSVATMSTPSRYISASSTFPAGSTKGTSASSTRLEAPAAASRMRRHARRSSLTHSSLSVPSNRSVQVSRQSAVTSRMSVMRSIVRVLCNPRARRIPAALRPRLLREVVCGLCRCRTRRHDCRVRHPSLESPSRLARASAGAIRRRSPRHVPCSAEAPSPSSKGETHGRCGRYPHAHREVHRRLQRGRPGPVHRRARRRPRGVRSCRVPLRRQAELPRVPAGVYGNGRRGVARLSSRVVPCLRRRCRRLQRVRRVHRAPEGRRHADDRVRAQHLRLREARPRLEDRERALLAAAEVRSRDEVRREAHGRHDRRDEEQPRAYALPPQTSTRRDPDRRSGRAEIRGYARGVVRSHAAPPTAPGAAFGGSRDAVPCKGWPARGVGDERTGFRNSATPAAELATRGGGLGGELSPLGSATPRRTVFRVGSPCTVAQSFGQQKASTTPTAWPKLTQSLTQWDLWRGGIAKRIKWLRLTAKHLKSVDRKVVRVRIPLPAL